MMRKSKRDQVTDSTLGILHAIYHAIYQLYTQLWPITDYTVV